MKRVQQRLVVCIVAFLILLTGCSEETTGNKYDSNKNSINDVLNAQTDGTTGTSTVIPTVKPTEGVTQTNDETSTPSLNEEKTDSTNTGTIETVDYDLTTMGSDMVYAMVYQLMVNPEDYIGKTFRMKGNYYSGFYEPTSQYYHYCMIQDATACCSQGIEFVWDNGEHVYPEEYPEQTTEIIVVGTFETYREDGDTNLYCRLRQASLEVSNNE